MSLSDFYEALAAKARRDETKDEARQTAGRPKTQQDREADRRQMREDMAYGARTARQRAVAADPEAQREAFHKAQALLIVNAGLKARGMPPRRCLVQDEEPSDEYHDEPGPGDDSPVDDQDHKTRKSKKKAKPAKIEDQSDDENGEDQPGDEGETEAQYWRRVNATAAAIVTAGKRRRGEI